MKPQFTTLILITSSLLPQCKAWGELGHETIAYIATNYVADATKTHFQTILGDTSTNYLASVAAWADSYRYTTAGRYSAPYHFIDAEDDPPTTCDVVYSRDCGSTGCVVRAIDNYTARVQSSTLSASEVTDAAKFLVHFIGDIHQPLHDENLDVGGNDISVTFDGTSTNLHAVWDTSIPEAIAGGSTLTSAQTWASRLISSITPTQLTSWTSHLTLSDPIDTATAWAQDANAYVCTAVMPDGAAAVGAADLGGAYYTRTAPVVEVLVSRAGVRLAAWLDLIATGEVGF